MNDVILEVKGFGFAYDETSILNDVNFQVFSGDFLSIIGPNGAGKTTLLRSINRILRGGRGEIFIKDKNLKSYKQKELARLVSYVPQSGNSMIPYPVYDFVMMGRYSHQPDFGRESRKDKEEVELALELTGTSYLRERITSSLSGGERQKVLIAAALVSDPEILLLDEPTTYLDPRHRSEISALLKKVNKDLAKTIISVTHDINSALLYSDQVIALKSGNITYSGSVEGLLKNNVLEDLFEKSFLLIEHPLECKPVIVD